MWNESVAVEGPAVAALPAADAYDYEFVRDRLRDPDLLLDSIAIRIYRAPLLAVPVGGTRRGGRLDTGSYFVAAAVRDLLCGRTGFPDVRVRPVPTPNVPHWRVEWGAPPPLGPPGSEALLSFYGYTLGPAAQRRVWLRRGVSLPLRRAFPPRDGGGEGPGLGEHHGRADV